MIIPARSAHFPLIELTPEGARELTEVYGMSLEETLRRNLAGSTRAWTMFCGTQVLCMFGIAPLSVLEGKGEFWVVGTVNICRHRLSFARQCKRFMPQLMADYREVWGVLEHGREDVVRWARWLGVEITPRDERLSDMWIRV